MVVAVILPIAKIGSLQNMDIQTDTVEAWMLCYAVYFIMPHFGHNLLRFFAADTLYHLRH